MFWKFTLNALLGRASRCNDPTAVYDALHDNPHLHFDPERPYWNYGLWDAPGRSMGEACSALCEEVAELAKLGPDDVVLDVGFGAGPQLDHWKARSPAWIVGLERSRLHLLSAREAGGGELLMGDGANLPFRDSLFDRVICVEAAFHFDTRERFFSEAYRVLRPGGVLVVTDLTTTERRSAGERAWWWAFSRVFFVPEVNRVSVCVYKDLLERLRFRTSLVVRTDEVFTPFLRAAGERLGRPLPRAACRALARVFERSPPLEYVFVAAQKGAEA